MKFSHYTRLKFARDGRILTVTITGQPPVNAVDDAMHDDLEHVFADLQHDPDSDLIILTGSGKAFCAGGDFDWFQRQVDEPARFRGIAHAGKKIISDMLALEKPIICRLNGAAAGLGASLALLCDVIIADETALIGDPHVKVGLVAGDGGAIIWPQLIGFARAKEYLLTGELLRAKQAAEIGLINYAVPAADLDAKVADMAARILANPRWAVRWTKNAVNIALRDLHNKITDAAIGYEVASNALKDRAEAVAAMREKRKPNFTGE